MSVLPKSPCVEICALNARTAYCTGCGRSLIKIAEWGTALPDRQREILAALPTRMAQLAAGLPVIPWSPSHRLRQMNPKPEPIATAGYAAALVVAECRRWL